MKIFISIVFLLLVGLVFGQSEFFDLRDLPSTTSRATQTAEATINTNYFEKVNGLVINRLNDDSWGANWVDFNNDGFEDLFVVNYDPQEPNRLYRNNGDKTFSKIDAGDLTYDLENSVSSAWADYDNDGDLDVFVSNNSGAQDYVYVNNGDETFSRLDDPVLTSESIHSHSAAWGDFDNDGFVDMFLGDYGAEVPNRLYRNKGDGTFESLSNSVVVQDLANTIGGNWLDYDNDGDIDLYVINSGGTENWLYKNIGNSQFVKETVPVGGQGGNSIGASWADYDNDGDLDLFVANASNQDNLFAEMVSRDDEDDACVTEDENGNKIDTLLLEQDKCRGCRTKVETEFLGCNSCVNIKSYCKKISKVIIQKCDGTKEKFRSFDGAKSIKICSRDGQDIVRVWVKSGCYTDPTAPNKSYGYRFESSCTDQVCYNGQSDVKCFKTIQKELNEDAGHSHGGTWIDIDNDADLDMFVINSSNMDNFLYINNGDGTFSKSNDPISSDGGNSFGVAWGDYDNDGDYDAFVTNHSDQKNGFYENIIGQENNSITVQLEGTNGNQTSIGAKIRVYATIEGKQVIQTREISTLTSGIGSQSSLKQIFGLGSATQADSVEVIWSSAHGGNRSVFEQQEAGTSVTFVEEEVLSLDEFMQEGITDYMNIYPNPTRGKLTLEIMAEDYGDVKIVLKDLQKNIYIVNDFKMKPGLNKFEYDLTQFATGIHLITVVDGNQVRTLKFMKMNE